MQKVKIFLSRITAGTKLLFLFIVFTASVSFASVLSAAHSQSESSTVQQAEAVASPSPSPTPDQTPHDLIGSYYTVEYGVNARLMLNNKDIVAREIRPTLYNLQGQPLELAPVTVDAGSFQIINLNDWASVGGENYRQGSLRLFHTGKALNIGAHI